MLQTACRQLLAWEGRPETRRLSIAVNVSVRQFSQHDVIAEGVETREQRDFLARAGCHAYQGYFFSRPLAPADLERYVRRGGYAAAAPALSAAS